MTRTVGFPIAKPAAIFGAEPYMHDVIAGMTRVLVPRGDSLLLRVVPSRTHMSATLREWAADGTVDGVVLLDLLPGDPLIHLVKELGIPTVVGGDPAETGGLATMWSQDDVVMRSAVSSLAAIGHERIGHLTGPSSMFHTLLRSRTFDECVGAAGGVGWRAEGDYSERSGYLAALELLGGTDRPTALIVDNDLMALGALTAAADLRLDVPGDVSIVAWDDSELCRSATPALSALTHDVYGVGELLARMIGDVMAGATPVMARPPAAEFLTRGTTAPPARVR